jgi:hypothetical protein
MFSYSCSIPFIQLNLKLSRWLVISPDLAGKYLFLPGACAEDNTNAGAFGLLGGKTPLAVFAIYITKI